MIGMNTHIGDSKVLEVFWLVQVDIVLLKMS
nr:MAG TPA: hypothetical protein [Caudoviricetes sp.]